MIKYDLKHKSLNELNSLAEELREKIIDVVSKNGGHLSSNLGSIELIIAIHKVFDISSDAIIYDVSHQAYAHKLLTDRWDSFNTLREFGGISGYIKSSESKYDYFGAGHSSTSLSLAVGSAKAFKLKNSKNRAIALVGDGALSSGIIYEALNEIGDIKLPVIIILNDNGMSISKPSGAISNLLARFIITKSYIKTRGYVKNLVINTMPKKIALILKRVEKIFIKSITPATVFKELGLKYVGPVDGHNIKELIDVFNDAKLIDKPIIIHTRTVKGKGYIHSENNINASWHGVKPFDIDTGISKPSSKNKSATDIYSDALLKLAKNHPEVVGVTAAMPAGTGLQKLIDEYPKRFYDVGIAEAHATTSMATLAKEGFKPFCTIYSTFLQRSFDHLIHDIGINKSNVNFALDRAGLVGDDGETHQGLFDIAYLRMIPNFTIYAPRNDELLCNAVEFAYKHNGPVAFRYPRGVLGKDEYKSPKLELGKLQILKDSDSDILLIGYGSGVSDAISTAQNLDIDTAIVDLRFIKPLDKVALKNLSKKYKKWYIFSESMKAGGVGSALLEFNADNNILDVNIKSFEIDDIFVTHGSNEKIKKSLKLDPKQISNEIKKAIKLSI